VVAASSNETGPSTLCVENKSVLASTRAVHWCVCGKLAGCWLKRQQLPLLVSPVSWAVGSLSLSCNVVNAAIVVLW